MSTAAVTTLVLAWLVLSTLASLFLGRAIALGHGQPSRPAPALAHHTAGRLPQPRTADLIVG